MSQNLCQYVGTSVLGGVQVSVGEAGYKWAVRMCLSECECAIVGVGAIEWRKSA